MLLNSWTPKQIVYHILRYVLNESGLSELRDSNDDRMLARYHIKTVMMWTCESEHSNWWMSSNVIESSRHIIQLLRNCCKSLFCRRYFISSSVTIGCTVSEAVTNQLAMFTELTYLTEWLVKRYTFKLSESYPFLEDWQFDEVSSKFIMNAIVELAGLHSYVRGLLNTQTACGFICSAVSRSTPSLDV